MKHNLSFQHFKKHPPRPNLKKQNPYKNNRYLQILTRFISSDEYILY